MTDSSAPAIGGTTEAELMTTYGITRVPADRFHYKSYRYTSLADAVAQAKRDAALS